MLFYGWVWVPENAAPAHNGGGDFSPPVALTVRIRKP